MRIERKDLSRRQYTCLKLNRKTDQRQGNCYAFAFLDIEKTFGNTFNRKLLRYMTFLEKLIEIQNFF